MVQLSSSKYVELIIAVFGATVAVTYSLFVVEGNDPFLPDISSLFVPSPASYISRFFLSLVCFMLAVSEKMMCSWGLVGAFCLSWAAAICSDPHAESCRGNRDLNAALLAGFFACYDLKILLDRNRYSLLLSSVIVGGALLKIRAVFEWANAVLIFAWLYGRLGHSSAKFYFGARGGEDALVWFVDTYRAMQITVSLYLGTLLTTAIVGVKAGYLPKVPGQLWFVSDMWAEVPGNWISRWSVVLGAHWGLVTLGGLYCVAETKLRKILVCFAAVGLLGLAVVGCCNENENIVIHSISALIFFGGYDVFMIGTVLTSKNASATCFAFAAIASQALRIFIPARAAVDFFGIVGSIPPLLEWTNAVAIIAFTKADVDAHSEECKNVVIGVADVAEQHTSSSSIDLLKEPLV